MVTDIYFDDEFWGDWDSVPPNIQKRFGNQLARVIDNGWFLPSDNIHKAAMLEETWIGYITRRGEHWRFLFNFRGSEVVIYRILRHSDMDSYLKLLTKS